MNSFFINDNDVHLWRVYLPDFFQQVESLLTLLSPGEIERANRFHFPEHRLRFITTRGLLRKTLQLYTHLVAAKIHFTYGARGKPYLADNPDELYFNVSHSHDYAVYALTRHKEIGVDIEKIEPSFKDKVAQRFFNDAEYAALMKLPETERCDAFYSLWARKEAVIKALGEGLYTSLESFSALGDTIIVKHEETQFHLQVKEFHLDAGYKAAFAISPPFNTISRWQWSENGSIAWL